MDKSPFNSPSPQDSPRLSSFTQHHRPVIVVHSGPGWKHARAPAPPPALTAQVQVLGLKLHLTRSPPRDRFVYHREVST
ncbi:nuclear factor 1 C-type-like isoform X2 [Oryctolagus cuniculus]|uniref:nuclear factor 1 C-type-like isoform X2 n=1 Tax=Oryctolagus cuniculus TaxID=9986 RepID=UPI0038794316